LDEREKHQKQKDALPVTTKVVEGPPPSADTFPERRLASFLFKASGNAAKVELDIKHTVSTVTITPKPSRHDEEITVIVQGPLLKLECKHIEQYEEDGKKITETIRSVQGITFPFIMRPQDVALKNNDVATFVEITKPSF